MPIVPDEARTFGMEALFRKAGIYSSEGQKYRPVDSSTLMPYREATDGQILQEGICEAGAMASFLAAGTAYAVHGVPTIPFYIFYSIFGFQRVGDMIWSCGDMLCRGFLLGGTSGRTTLNGEGLQHQDGHSQVIASTVPNLLSYDPAFACELAVIIREGIRRMYEQQENVFYYITIHNENYAMPADGRWRRPRASFAACTASRRAKPVADKRRKAHLFGSGAIMTEVLRAQALLEDARRLRRRLERHQLQRTVPRRHCAWNGRTTCAGRATAGNSPMCRSCWPANTGVFVAASDYMKSLPLGICPLGARPLRRARHRWLRPQRVPGRSAQLV